MMLFEESIQHQNLISKKLEKMKKTNKDIQNSEENQMLEHDIPKAGIDVMMRKRCIKRD